MSDDQLGYAAVVAGGLICLGLGISTGAMPLSGGEADRIESPIRYWIITALYVTGVIVAAYRLIFG